MINLLVFELIGDYFDNQLISLSDFSFLYVNIFTVFFLLYNS